MNAKSDYTPCTDKQTVREGVIQQFNAMLALVDLDAKFRCDCHGEWQAVADQLDYYPVNYSAAWIDYQISYWQGKGTEIHDVSIVIYYEHRPVGIWPLSVTSGGVRGIGSNGGELQPPIFDHRLVLKAVRKTISACLDLVDKFCRTNAILAWSGTELQPSKHWLSEWHIEAMQRGAEAVLRYDTFVDLSLDMAAIKSRFRKSYKSLITSGAKHFQVGVIGREGSAEIWKEFRMLHLEAAGYATRTEETWNLQYMALLNGEIFLVELRDHAGRMVGGALFNLTHDEGYYSVGAYDRDLFDKPIGHLIQYRAIEEMKRLGLRWYHIGKRPFPSEQPPLTDKQLAIVHFQNGFATHILPRFLLSRKVVSEDSNVQYTRGDAI